MTPPSFEAARTRHQKARAAGLHPDYWYAVEWDHAVKPGQVVEIVFWKKSIALYRGEDGVLRAVDDRCAHRQLKLSAGNVKGCNLVCLYHGWEHGEDGRIAHIPHERFGKQIPKSKITTYPVQVRHGLIWIFPGDPALASVREVPAIPELAEGWPSVPVDATWNGHHSMIIDNVSDFTHEYLHEKYKPFSDPELTKLEVVDDRVHVGYRTKVGGDPKTEMVLNPSIDRGSIELCYSYPYQWSDTDGKIKHWCFVLPIDERRTRVFFLFLFAPDTYRLPFTRIRMPLAMVRGMLKIAKRAYIVPLLEQDRVAIEAEQVAHELHHDLPIPELNPAVQEFQRLTISKWEEALA
ncbi:aromatic ring-hydroxylating dioxygenase subunit alpha [Lentzea tibetensis]|uniref:Aromatic ring-hydroxylating dioxygenase subunit alpha n=1 Tax=Lentzea tibetensis TaxID=2591470 RepID=A0A563ELZ8_9PSEU|nr:aromatic ring-hydroxylating dioxygenase subunit alpha [Lentzea tibetensis]TWP48110.1 aromatic ring-hydroxylating dioxygenase subunit alpha [Lentzea tibetensis]